MQIQKKIVKTLKEVYPDYRKKAPSFFIATEDNEGNTVEYR